MKKILLIIMTFILFFILGCGGQAKQFNELNLPSRDTWLLRMATADVTKQLKTPSTAIFPSELSEYKIYQSSENKEEKTIIYKVISYVDAQNLFGAKMRYYYVADIEVKNAPSSNGSYSYRVNSVEFIQN